MVKIVLGRNGRVIGASVLGAGAGDLVLPWALAISQKLKIGAMANLTAVLDAAGCGWDDVVKTTIFLADVGDFATVNGIYARFLAEPPPARSTIGVGALPKGARVEVEAVARLRA